MPDNLESKVDLSLARLETIEKKLENINTWRVNSTNWKVESRSSKIHNRPQGTPLERWKMAFGNLILKLMKLEQPTRKLKNIVKANAKRWN